ncbi:MAG: SURF1 family protein [Mycobacterium sp.]|nr:SURF1 family protein [Mycobacterium sp.]
MKRLGFLLRPGWIALALVVVGFAYLCFTVLAPWQLGKNTATSRENRQINASLSADPVALTSVLPHQDSSAPEAQWRRVTATGHYLPDKQVLARLRVVEGQPAFEVLLPFAVDDGPTVLVNRGYVRPEGGSRVPAIAAPPSGTLTLEGRLRDSETAPPDRKPFTEQGFRQVYAIDTQQLSQLLGVPLTGSYVQLSENQAGGLGVAPLPHLDAGPFLSYGIQWIAFGIVAPIGLAYFVYSELMARRREKETAPDAPLTAEDKLADRYGRRR